MDKIESLSHSKWECKYHVVFTAIPAVYAHKRPSLAQTRLENGQV